MLGNADALQSNALNSLQMPLLLHCLYGIWREIGSHKKRHQTPISVPRGLVQVVSSH
ncbi:hypothetical protein GGI42DRAFT_318662 [Trichoderma sp. SZMC 28013]